MSEPMTDAELQAIRERHSIAAEFCKGALSLNQEQMDRGNLLAELDRKDAERLDALEEAVYWAAGDRFCGDGHYWKEQVSPRFTLEHLRDLALAGRIELHPDNPALFRRKEKVE